MQYNFGNFLSNSDILSYVAAQNRKPIQYQTLNIKPQSTCVAFLDSRSGLRVNYENCPQCLLLLNKFCFLLILHKQGICQFVQNSRGILTERKKGVAWGLSQTQIPMSPSSKSPSIFPSHSSSSHPSLSHQSLSFPVPSRSIPKSPIQKPPITKSLIRNSPIYLSRSYQLPKSHPQVTYS